MLRGETLRIEDVKTVVDRMIANFRARLEALPLKTAPLMFGLKDVARIDAILREAVEEAICDLREQTTTDFKTASSAYVRTLDAGKEDSPDDGTGGDDDSS